MMVYGSEGPQAIFGCSLPTWSVTLDGNTQSANSGSITFNNLYPGIHSYSISATGYSMDTNSGTVAGNTELKIIFFPNQ
jgi:hypothetical protein